MIVRIIMGQFNIQETQNTFFYKPQFIITLEDISLCINTFTNKHTAINMSILCIAIK